MSRKNEDTGKLMRKVFGTHPNEAVHSYIFGRQSFYVICAFHLFPFDTSRISTTRGHHSIVLFSSLKIHWVLRRSH